MTTLILRICDGRRSRNNVPFPFVPPYRLTVIFFYCVMLPLSRVYAEPLAPITRSVDIPFLILGSHFPSLALSRSPFASFAICFSTHLCKYITLSNEVSFNPFYFVILVGNSPTNVCLPMVHLTFPRQPIRYLTISGVFRPLNICDFFLKPLDAHLVTLACSPYHK